MHVSAPLALRDGDRGRLEELARSSTVAQRALIVLLAADGLANTQIAQLAGTSRPTVLKWRHRYQAHGIAGLDDEARPGRPATIDEIEVLGETLADGGQPPAFLGVPHWSARLMADRLGISFASVARIWRKYDIRTQRIEAFKFLVDPALEARFHDLVGLYLSQPVGAFATSKDAKSARRALDHTEPILQLCPCIAERQAHDDTRSGATGLFAALESAVGKIRAPDCHSQDTHAEFIDFLEVVSAAHPGMGLHVICDNDITGQHPAVRAWRDQNPRVSMHCTQAGRSWLTAAGIAIGLTTRQAMRRGMSSPLEDLETAMRNYIDTYNERANPFGWTKNPDAAIANAKRQTINNTRAG
jgi:transposase